MSETNEVSPVERLVTCNCGKPIGYAHFKNGEETMSCNKYTVCPTYDELLEKTKLTMKYKRTLERIAATSAMDYEYRSWAKTGLDT
jgi:hypothetical protein